MSSFFHGANMAGRPLFPSSPLVLTWIYTCKGYARKAVFSGLAKDFSKAVANLSESIDSTAYRFGTVASSFALLL